MIVWLKLIGEFEMTTNGEKFNAICEFFPVTAREMAKSAEVGIGELRALIVRGDYYIDDRCRLRRNATVKAFNELADAVNKLNAKEPLQKANKKSGLLDISGTEDARKYAQKVLETRQVKFTQKETTMIDLTGTKAGDKFVDYNRNVVTVLFVDDGDIKGFLGKIGTCRAYLYDLDGKTLNGSFAALSHKYEPRWWLKDLPDADIFNDGWLAYNNGVAGWYFFESEPNDKIQAGESMCSVRCLDCIKMPKLTGDEWRDSKISIPDLKAWQEKQK